MKPSVGRIVHYTLSQHDADAINRRRVANTADPAWPAGAQAHHGNTVRAGEVYPLLITRVWNLDPGTINGQVFLDGSDSLWVTSVTPGEGPCHWFQPPRVEG